MDEKQELKFCPECGQDTLDIVYRGNIVYCTRDCSYKYEQPPAADPAWKYVARDGNPIIEGWYLRAWIREDGSRSMTEETWAHGTWWGRHSPGTFYAYRPIPEPPLMTKHEAAKFLRVDVGSVRFKGGFGKMDERKTIKIGNHQYQLPLQSDLWYVRDANFKLVLPCDAEAEAKNIAAALNDYRPWRYPSRGELPTRLGYYLACREGWNTHLVYFEAGVWTLPDEDEVVDVYAWRELPEPAPVLEPESESD